MEGTNKAHENGEAMGFVGVRLTVMLGHADSHPKCNTLLKRGGAGILQRPLSGKTGVATWRITNSLKKKDTSFPVAGKAEHRFA